MSAESIEVIRMCNELLGVYTRGDTLIYFIRYVDIFV